MFQKNLYQLAFIIFLIFLSNLSAISQPLNWSSDLPIISIFTMGNTIVNEPKVQAQWAVYWNPDGSRNDLSQSPHDMGFIGVEYRGQSSQMFPMKSMTVETRNYDGTDRELELLGMPEESDWVLYSTFYDKSLIRNVLTYDLARETERWAPKTKFVEVWINTEYFGIYVLVEKIKRDSQRVDIKKLKGDQNDGINLSGGYIFKIDKQSPNDFSWVSSYASNLFHPSRSGSSVSFQGVYPKSDNITNSQRSYITSYVDSMEMAIASENFNDTIHGYRRYLEPSSFVDFLLVNEINRNVDGYRISSYFHKNRSDLDGRVHAGPLWDFDLAFANANFCDAESTEGFAYELEAVCPAGQWPVPFWWGRLMTDSIFRNLVGCRWQYLRGSVWNESKIFQKMSNYASETQEARGRHFSRWPIFGQQIWVYPDPIATSYQQEINNMRDFIIDRWEWLDNNLPVGINCVAKDTSTSPNEIMDSIELIVSPNPGFAGNQKFYLFLQEGGAAYIQVSDFCGRTIFSYNRYVNSNLNELVQLNNLTLKPGVYHITIELRNKGILTSRFVVI